jgi:hypothetical protein
MNRLVMCMTLILVIPTLLFAQINWTKHNISTSFDGARNVVAIDIDDDEDVDVLGVAFSGDDIAWWGNNGSSPPGFALHNINTNFDGANSIYAIDLDDDDDIDVLGGALYVDHLVWWENNGSESFTAHVLINLVFPSVQMAIDLDDDGDIDVIGSSNATDSVCWFENDGNENFTKHVISSTFDGANSAYAVDIDDDNDLDVIGSAGLAGSIVWWENDGNENFTEHVITNTFDGANSVFGIDLDDDGDIDALSAARYSDDIAWFENDGNENFTQHTIASSFDGAKSVCACDMDNDGDLDVVGAAYTGDEVTWWENDGGENFTEHTIETDFSGAWCIDAADFDSDGDQDIVGTSYNYDDVVWWESDFAKKDAGVVSIDIPLIVHVDTTFNPVSTVANLSTLDETLSFDVTCKIDDAAYTLTYAVTDLPKGDSMQIAFDSPFAFSMGHHTVTIFTILPDDGNRTNDTLVIEVEAINYYDVGTVSINVPSAVPEDTSFNPHATVTNLGKDPEIFNVTCAISPGEYNSTTVSNVAPRESIQVTFPDEFTFESGSYTVTVYTRLPGDENPTNDTLEKVIETQDPGITVDVGTVTIDVPDTVSIGTLINPHATVKNFGSETEVFNVSCIIEPGSYISTTVSNLAPEESIQVTFPDAFQFDEIGSYTVTVYTDLSGDENPSNDTLEKVVIVHDPGVAEGNSEIPQSFSCGLSRNPVKSKALFNLALPEDASITLNIYDVSGRFIDRLISKRMLAGYYQIPWSTKINGVYFYFFESKEYRKSGKLIFVK